MFKKNYCFDKSNIITCWETQNVLIKYSFKKHMFHVARYSITYGGSVRSFSLENNCLEILVLGIYRKKIKLWHYFLK